ncbi:MAG: polysaccharide pyruvyl transferase family protein [Acetobacteraceae bacterium]
MRLAVIGKSPFVVRTPDSTPTDLFMATGSNTGNLAFGFAAHQIMAGSKTYFDWDFDPATLNRRFDAAVLVCANMINPALDLGQLADRLAALTVPLCVFSIGCQGPLGSGRFVLPPGSIRFLYVVARKCRSFGVRGATSARFLSALGIENWQIVGCPSNMLAPPPGARRRMEQRVRRDGPVLLHVDLVGDFPVLMGQLRALAGGPVHYMAQSPFTLVDLALARSGPLTASQQALVAKFGIGDGPDATAVLRDTLHAFFSVEEWCSFTSRFDFSLGVRLHGNIIAMRCGVPCLVVMHDERMRELAETHALPALTMEDFLATRAAGDLRTFVADRLDAYWDRSAVLARRFTSLLRENGIGVVEETPAPVCEAAA